MQPAALWMFGIGLAMGLVTDNSDAHLPRSEDDNGESLQRLLNHQSHWNLHILENRLQQMIDFMSRSYRPKNASVHECPLLKEIKEIKNVDTFLKEVVNVYNFMKTLRTGKKFGKKRLDKNLSITAKKFREEFLEIWLHELDSTSEDDFKQCEPGGLRELFALENALLRHMQNLVELGNSLKEKGEA